MSHRKIFASQYSKRNTRAIPQRKRLENILDRVTKKITVPEGNVFCEYIFGCDGADPNCFHPYKTKGCSLYLKRKEE